MEPRLRAGLIAGGGAALATLLLSLSGAVFCGPIVAIIGGLSAGMQIARDPRYARAATGAGAIAGLYAGLIVGVAQIIGMVILLTTPNGQQAIDQMLTQSSMYTTTMIWFAFIFLAFILAAIDIGIMAGGAALIARNLTHANTAPQRYAGPPPSPNTYYVPQPGTSLPPPPPPSYVPPVAVRAYAPPPPTYPPPPSYYGFPDITPPVPPDDTPPATAEAAERSD